MGCAASANSKQSGKEPAGVLPNSNSKMGAEAIKKNLKNDNQGKVTDFYEMEKKKIGEGAFGAVCKARNKATKAMRAIKTINKAAQKKQKEKETLQKEIAIHKVLDHPNICKLYEVFEDALNIYLVLELCVGGELFDRIIEVGHLRESQAALLMQNMFRSLYYMHECHYTHRDLKPENFIFTTKESVETSTLKLIDFGLAREFKVGQELTTKAGTPYYVSPQVLDGRYDQSADMWSLGVIMFILLCGYPPFYGTTDDQVLRAVKVGKFEFLPEDWKHISEDAKNLIRHLLTMKPKARCTAEQALNHIWIQETAPSGKDVNLHESGVVEKLSAFRGQNKLKKAALQVIAKSLDDQKIMALRDIFTKLDQNGDGLLTAAELQAGLTEAGITEIPTDLDDILKAVDSDGSGIIDYSEFLAATLDRHHMQNEDVCWQAFRVFDRDGNGKISKAELSQVLADGDVKDTFHKELADLMAENDLDGDGDIDFAEFMAMMRK